MAFKGKKTPVNADKSTDSEFVKKFKANPLLFTGTLFVLVIVIVAFVMVPAFGGGFGQTGDLTFGYYDKIPISYVPGNAFAAYVESASQYYRNMGDAYNNSFIMQQIWRTAFDEAAFRVAVLDEMKKAGYSAPKKVVDKEVAQQFIIDGKFSSALYNRYDQNDRLAMWRRTQEDIAVKRYLADMEGLIKPEQATQFFAKMASPVRTFDLVSFPVSAYPDSEIAAYAEEHLDLFRQTHLSRITVLSSEREARQILNSIHDGSITFEDAARAHSQDTYSERGGDMGIKMSHELYTEIPGEAEREQVIALGKEELSGVLKIDSGWAIFRAEEAVQPLDIDDTETLERVRSYIQTFERSRMENWALNKAEQFIAAVHEKGFDSALGETGLSKQSFGPIPLNYGDVDLFNSLASASIPELSGSSRDENFWKAAFGTELNTPHEPLVQGGNVLVLIPTSEEEADENAVESIRSYYTNYWIGNTNNQAMRPYFLNSSKMDDRFIEIFFRYIMPLN